MKHPITNDGGEVTKRSTGAQGQARIFVLALFFFFMGLVVGAFWFSRKPSAEVASQTDLPHDPARSGDLSPKPQSAPPSDLAALNAVKRAIPNVNSASLEAGTRVLREAAVAEFQKTVRELQARQKKVEQDFTQGQANQSDEQQRIATKQLQELQAEQMEKLKQIAANSKAQIDAFQQLKGAVQ